MWKNGSIAHKIVAGLNVSTFPEADEETASE